MATDPRVPATNGKAAKVLRWDDSVRSCTIPGRSDLLREGLDLRSLSWSRADRKEFKARERACRNAPASDDASSVDTAASTSSMDSIASAFSCADSVMSAATCSCSKCGGMHDAASCPSFDKNRLRHSDGQPCPVSDRTAVGRYNPIHGRVLPMPEDCDCVYWALTFGGVKSDRSVVRSTRAELADFMRDNPSMQSYGSDVTYANRSQGEFKLPLGSYAARMRDSWIYGGMFELDAYSKKHQCRVVVYERAPDGMFQAISSCEVSGFTSTRHLLYDSRRKHFDILVPESGVSLPAAAASADGDETVN